MSRAETFLKLALGDEGGKLLDKMCDQLGYDDSDRELAAEVILVSWIDTVKDEEEFSEAISLVRDYWKIPTNDYIDIRKI